jgi:hypothetical protein
MGNADHCPLVLDPTIAGMTATKVLIDGGARLYNMFRNTKEDGTRIHRDDYSNKHSFYKIVLSKAAMPLG